MPRVRPYSAPLDTLTVSQLLNSEIVDGVPLGDALAVASRHLAGLVERANALLEGNEVARLIAEREALKAHRKTRAEVRVSATGQVLVEIGHSEPAVKMKRRRNPLLKELRVEAASLGIEVAHLGIARKKIALLISKTKIEGKPQKAQVRPPEEDLGPMSAGPDETRLIPATDQPLPPKRRGVLHAVEVSALIIDEETSTSPSIAPPKLRTMRQMVEQSRDVDIAALLSTDPPK